MPSSDSANHEQRENSPLSQNSLDPTSSDASGQGFDYEELAGAASHAAKNLENLWAKLAAQQLESFNAATWSKVQSALDRLVALSPDYSAMVERASSQAADAARAPLRDMRAVQQHLMRLATLNYPRATTATRNFMFGVAGPRYRGAQTVWHYTGAAALDQILQRHVLWATSAQHLNDSSELSHGFDIIREAVDSELVASRLTPERRDALAVIADRKQLDDAIADVFLISGSLNADSLTLWRNYSLADGFALGLRPRAALEPSTALPPQSRDGGETLPPAAKPGWFKVEYQVGEKRRLARDFVVRAIEDLSHAPTKELPTVIDELRKHLVVLAASMKHDAFKDEREVRWIATTWLPSIGVHFPVTRRGFVPVLHVKSAESEDQLPVTGLRCSPTSPETGVSVMARVLASRGYESASRNVHQSRIPYRG